MVDSSETATLTAQGDEPRDVEVAVVLAGTAWSVPGRTREDGAAIAMEALQRAAGGHRVLDPAGQRLGWLHRCFLASQLGVGAKTWKHFKRVYTNEIELDGTQQWVRLRPSTAG